MSFRLRGIGPGLDHQRCRTQQHQHHGRGEQEQLVAMGAEDRGIRGINAHDHMSTVPSESLRGGPEVNADNARIGHLRELRADSVDVILRRGFRFRVGSDAVEIDYRGGAKALHFVGKISLWHKHWRHL